MSDRSAAPAAAAPPSKVPARSLTKAREECPLQQALQEVQLQVLEQVPPVVVVRQLAVVVGLVVVLGVSVVLAQGQQKRSRRRCHGGRWSCPRPVRSARKCRSTGRCRPAGCARAGCATPACVLFMLWSDARPMSSTAGRICSGAHRRRMLPRVTHPRCPRGSRRSLVRSSDSSGSAMCPRLSSSSMGYQRPLVAELV